MNATRIVLLALLGATLPAQPQRESRGLFAGAPVTVSLDSAAGVPFAADQLYVKRPGFRAGVAPKSWTTAGVPAGRPSFDIRAMLNACRAPKGLDVDAMSIGEDWVIADKCTGKAVVPPGRWAAITFSVTRTTNGKTGGAIRRESGTMNGAAADMFSYVLRGSAMPSALVAVTHRALDSREIDLGSGTVKRNVNAVDQFIPMYTLESGIANPAPSGMMPTTLQLFFSLSKATAGSAPSAWFGTSGSSGATILKVTWDPRGRRWSCPRPFKTYKDIGLDPGEDIDAIAIDLLNQRMLFSTDISIRPRDPILYLNWKSGCLTTAIETYADPTTGKPISEEIGLIGSDDVDAICATDPSIRTRGSRRNALYYVVGTPQVPLGIFPPRLLNGSSFRDFSGGSIVLRTYVLGWPQNTGPAPGLAGLFITPVASVTPFVHVANYARMPANPVVGDPRGCPLVIPPAFSLLGVPLYLRWFAVTGTGMFAEAWPILLRH